METLSPMRVWRDLGVVDTIYEEEGEDSSTAPSLSPVISLSPVSPLHFQVEAWSVASGHEPDVVIYVQGSSFNLHKAPLLAKSGYLKRLLKESTQFTLSPPLKITAGTFSLVTEFCYGTHIPMTPFNVAPLRIAADLLDMTDSIGTPTDNLLQKTETYFRHIVSVNREHASIVLQSSLSLLPEAETTACLVTRCIEALSSMDESDAGVATSLDEVIKLPPEDFQVVVESMNQRFTSHDLLYRIVDLYLKESLGKIREEQKIRICNSIDCTTLSSQLLMHAVQNPRMPLRFVVQAMFVEQLNTRRSILSAADHRNRTKHQSHQCHESEDPVTLGAILERDAALRQVAQLKEAMNTTNSRIQSLEKELIGMRKLLHESEDSKKALDSGRAQSFRFSSQNKVERGQIGSVSSASLRFTASKDKMGCSSSSEESFDRSSPVEKNFGRRMINGLKSAFWVSTLVSKKKSDGCDRGRLEGAGYRGECMSYDIGKGDVIVIKKKLPFHRQSATQT